MNFIRLTQQVASFSMAAIVTLSVLLGLNGLAAPDTAALSQMVSAASAPKA